MACSCSRALALALALTLTLNPNPNQGVQLQSCRLPEQHFKEATAFYRREGYRRKCRPGDLVFVLRRGTDDNLADELELEQAISAQSRIVGAVRCTRTLRAQGLAEREAEITPSDGMYLVQSLCIARAARESHVV